MTKVYKPGQFVTIGGKKCRVKMPLGHACAECKNVWNKLHMLTPCREGGSKQVNGKDTTIFECIKKLEYYYPGPLKK